MKDHEQKLNKDDQSSKRDKDKNRDVNGFSDDAINILDPTWSISPMRGLDPTDICDPFIIDD